MDGTTLVTGGAGFIGSHLADALLARGGSVVVLDDQSTGRIANLDAVVDHPRFRFVHGSILDELLTDDLVRRCDTVVHLAAAVGVELVLAKPLQSLITNVHGSHIVIDAASRHHRKVLLASTSEIYGKNASGPLAETDDRILGSPTVARWAYSTAKAIDEILANAYHLEHGLEAIVVRLFNTVGPRQSPAYGMVIPRLIRQALAGEPLTVYGTGRQTRCFAHVTDVVSALVALLDEPAAVGQTFNVGTNQEVSILHLARAIIEHTDSDSEVRFVPYDEAYGAGFEDMTRRVPDTGKLRGLTGWVPGHTLDDAIRDTVAEMRAGGVTSGAAERVGLVPS